MAGSARSQGTGESHRGRLGRTIGSPAEPVQKADRASDTSRGCIVQVVARSIEWGIDRASATPRGARPKPGRSVKGWASSPSPLVIKYITVRQAPNDFPRRRLSRTNRRRRRNYRNRALRKSFPDDPRTFAPAALAILSKSRSAVHFPQSRAAGSTILMVWPPARLSVRSSRRRARGS